MEEYVKERMILEETCLITSLLWLYSIVPPTFFPTAR
jgi:hypothetical protein